MTVMARVAVILKHIWYIPRYLVMGVIWAYQRTLSPDHGLFKVMFPGGYCKYRPTCSEYSLRVVHKRGVVVGVPLALWRVLRCNPWSKGGNDPA